MPSFPFSTIVSVATAVGACDWGLFASIPKGFRVDQVDLDRFYDKTLLMPMRIFFLDMFCLDRRKYDELFEMLAQMYPGARSDGSWRERDWHFYHDGFLPKVRLTRPAYEDLKSLTSSMKNLCSISRKKDAIQGGLSPSSERLTRHLKILRYLYVEEEIPSPNAIGFEVLRGSIEPTEDEFVCESILEKEPIVLKVYEPVEVSAKDPNIPLRIKVRYEHPLSESLFVLYRDKPLIHSCQEVRISSDVKTPVRITKFFRDPFNDVRWAVPSLRKLPPDDFDFLGYARQCVEEAKQTVSRFWEHESF